LPIAHYPRARSHGHLDISAERFAVLARHIIGKRAFDFRERFLPDVLSRVERLHFLQEEEKALLSQIQAQTYLQMFNSLERATCARALDACRAAAFGNRTAIDALAEFADRKARHQGILECVERMIVTGQPAGRETVAHHAVTHRLADASPWAVLALLCHFGACAERHHLDSDSPYASHSAIFADAMRFHRPTYPIDASFEVMEWRRANARMNDAERHRGVHELAQLLDALDRIGHAQAGADTSHLEQVAGRSFSPDQREQLNAEVRTAYRWQFVTSGLCSRTFASLLDSMTSRTQQETIRLTLLPQEPCG
jgi:hypothetical protein